MSRPATIRGRGLRLAAPALVAVLALAAGEMGKGGVVQALADAHRLASDWIEARFPLLAASIGASLAAALVVFLATHGRLRGDGWTRSSVLVGFASDAVMIAGRADARSWSASASRRVVLAGFAIFLVFVAPSLATSDDGWAAVAAVAGLAVLAVPDLLCQIGDDRRAFARDRLLDRFGDLLLTGVLVLPVAGLLVAAALVVGAGGLDAVPWRSAGFAAVVLLPLAWAAAAALAVLLCGVARVLHAR